jgi:hypothetical protein
MSFDQVGTQLAERPTPIRLADLARRLFRQLRDAVHLTGAYACGRAARLQVGHRCRPSGRKSMQIGVDRVDMHALRLSNLQRVEPQAVQQQAFRAALLVAISQAIQLPLQLLDFACLRAANVQWASHGLASWSETGHSNND